MKEKITLGYNVVWQHNDTYSILRKVSTCHPKVFDFVLQPPLIVKNCLPCSVVLDLSTTSKRISTIDVQNVQ